jgi:hypothetical protein
MCLSRLEPARPHALRVSIAVPLELFVIEVGVGIGASRIQEDGAGSGNRGQGVASRGEWVGWWWGLYGESSTRTWARLAGDVADSFITL